MDRTDWKNALGALLPADYQPEAEAEAEAPSELPRPRLKVTLDRKRAGKTATIISGFAPDDPRAAGLAALLKKKLATGGSSRGGEILIQGDCVDRVRDILRSEHWKV